MKKYREWLYKFAQKNGLGKTVKKNGKSYENSYDFGRYFDKDTLVGFWFAGESDEEHHSLQIGRNWLNKSDNRLYAGNDRAVAFLRAWFPGAEVVCCFKKEEQTVAATVKAAKPSQPVAAAK